MKKLLLLLLTIISLQAKAQFINLPDSNFRNALMPFYPTCFNVAKQLDTNCAKISSLPSITLRNKKIINTNGFQYFIKLTSINLDSNVSINITNIPSSCVFFTARFCNLSSFPTFPERLLSLNLSNNNLTSISSLPSALTSLNCSFNKLISLPNLGSSLSQLTCSKNNLISLPSLPKSIASVQCPYNNLLSLPKLDTLVNLTILDVSNNNLNSLPSLHSSLVRLVARNNSIVQFPNYNDTALKNWTLSLSLSNNLITQLPNNLQLKFLEISNNPISSIPKKMSCLEGLNCMNTSITSLPDSLFLFNSSLNCINTKIDSFQSALINNLKDIESLALSKTNLIDYSFISNLSRLKQLYLDSTSIRSISKFPTNLTLVWAGDCKNLVCLPKLNDSMSIYIDSSNIACISNITSKNLFYNYKNRTSKPIIDLFTGDTLFSYTYALFTIPLCSPTNNVNNCASFPNIVGSVYVDENNNNTKDPNEQFRANVPVRLTATNRTVTNANGGYVLMADSIGSQTVTVTAPRFYTAVPSTVNLNFGRYDTLVNVPPIALQKTISKDSLAVKITPIWWAARPGFPYPFLVQYENVGSNTVNANINLSFNSNALNYDSSSTTVNATTGNIQLLRNNFTPGSQGGFISYFRVKPSATLLGTNLKTWASIVGGTALASDTTRRIIGGSYDPNDKLATPQLTTIQVAEGQFINYTVRFQNTGTDTAFTVVIADTLNSLLQANTFELLGSSHTCKTIIQDNKIYFEFRNILLPDSTTNLIGSNGFVNFRIKPISSVALNTSIPNKAAIYFDYNEPIITNTASTLISNTILPLQLVRFNVLYKQSSGVLFNWETKNEQAIKEFVVEESKDAINFKAFQQTQSKGNGDNTYFSNANYTNSEMIGSKFYRLKTISSNGNIAYSQIVKLNFDKSIQPFIILQNPVKGSLQIQVNAQSLHNTEALLINQEGKVVQGFKLQLGSQTISLGNLGIGVYSLKTKEGSSLVVVN